MQIQLTNIYVSKYNDSYLQEMGPLATFKCGYGGNTGGSTCYKTRIF